MDTVLNTGRKNNIHIRNKTFSKSKAPIKRGVKPQDLGIEDLFNKFYDLVDSLIESVNVSFVYTEEVFNFVDKDKRSDLAYLREYFKADQLLTEATKDVNDYVEEINTTLNIIQVKISSGVSSYLDMSSFFKDSRKKISQLSSTIKYLTGARSEHGSNSTVAKTTDFPKELIRYNAVIGCFRALSEVTTRFNRVVTTSGLKSFLIEREELIRDTIKFEKYSPFLEWDKINFLEKKEEKNWLSKKGWR